MAQDAGARQYGGERLTKVVRWAIVVALWLAYGASFTLVDEILGVGVGGGAAMLSAVPPLVAAALLGVGAGLANALAAYPINLIVYGALATDPDQIRLPAAVFGHVGTLVLAIVIGRLRDVSRKLNSETLSRQQAMRELARSEEQLRHAQKLEAVGRLAGGIAHDFNNLLTVILTHSALLKQDLVGMPTARHVREIHRSATRGASLVRRILAFGRRQVLQPRVLDLRSVLDRMQGLLRRLIEVTIQLEVVHGKDVANVRFDESALEQVLVNLVLNARDAMPRGGQLRIETLNADGSDAAFAALEMSAGPKVIIAVRDTGVGISPSNIERVFEPFFTTKEVGEGSGLGLPMVHGIVKQSGGDVLVESREGEGTVVRVVLPSVDEPAEDSDPVLTSDAGDDPEAATILFVEGDDAVREGTSELLRRRGFRVIEATGGEEALALADEERGGVDLLLTDVVMAQMDGFELAAHLHRRWPGIPVLYVSGYSEEVFRERFEGAPGAYLAKPFSIGNLSRKISDVLDESA